MNTERFVGAVAPVLLLATLGILGYRVLHYFLPALTWAAILAYIGWPLHLRMHRLARGRETIAALISITLFSTVIVLPLVWIGVLTQREIVSFARRVPIWLEQKPSLPGFAQRIPFVGPEVQQLLEPFDNLRGLLQAHGLPWLRGLSGRLLNVVEDVGHTAMQLFFCLLSAFFLFLHGDTLIHQLRKFLELAIGARFDTYLATTTATVKAVVYGIVLAAAAQSALAGLGYWMVGITAPLLLGLLTFFFALIPFGAPMVWISTALWLAAHGEYWAAVSLGLWGGLVVSWIDNLVRPLVISGASRIPFLLVFFGVLGGLAEFGLIGLFVGPLVLAIGLAVWREWLEAKTVA